MKRTHPGRGLFAEEAQSRYREAIEAVEEVSAAEVVVALRRRSAWPWHAYTAGGLVVSWGCLAALVYLPIDFEWFLWPLEVPLAFVVGACAVFMLAPLERLLSGRVWRRRQVARASRSDFIDHGLTATRDHTGLLIFVSAAERELELVADVGLAEAMADQALEAVREDLRRAMQRDDAVAFADAMRALAEPLAAHVPAREDDVNELPDAPMVEPSIQLRKTA